MKYFEYMGQILPGLKKGWLKPKNPHNCTNTGTCPVVDSTASPVTEAKATTATNQTSAATPTTAKPFKPVTDGL